MDAVIEEKRVMIVNYEQTINAQETANVVEIREKDIIIDRLKAACVGLERTIFQKEGVIVETERLLDEERGRIACLSI